MGRYLILITITCVFGYTYTPTYTHTHMYVCIHNIMLVCRVPSSLLSHHNHVHIIRKQLFMGHPVKLIVVEFQSNKSNIVYNAIYIYLHLVSLPFPSWNVAVWHLMFKECCFFNDLQCLFYKFVDILGIKFDDQNFKNGLYLYFSSNYDNQNKNMQRVFKWKIAFTCT